MKTNILKLLITTDSEKILSYSANRGENYIQRQHLDLIRHTTPEYSSRNTISFEKVGDSYIMIGHLSAVLEIALGQQVEFDDSLVESEIASVLLQELVYCNIDN